MRFLVWFVALLDSPRSTGWIIGAALVLTLPALVQPLVIDDLIQLIQLDDDLTFLGEAGSGVSDYFVFASGDPDHNALQVEDGVFPWWTSSYFKLAFARPLSAATHVLDFTLWPGNSVLMHAQSLLWFGLLLLTLASLYSRFHSPVVAGLALALYAFDDAHWMLVGWVANRNAIIATVLGALVLIVHDRWRRDGWRPGAVLGPLLLAVGLLAGESAIAVTGFLFGYALSLDSGSLSARLGRLVPYALVVVGWQVGYDALGYGVEGSAVYTHPIDDPATYLGRVLVRGPILAAAQLGPVPSDLWVVVPSGLRAVLWVLAGAVIAAMGTLLWPLLRSRPTARFWAIGASLALIPVCAVFPLDRLLVFVGVGVAPVLAEFLVGVVGSPPKGRFGAAAVTALVGLHLVLAPALLPPRIMGITLADLALDRFDAAVPTSPEVETRTLVVVVEVSDAAPAYSRWRRVVRGVPKAGKQRLLCTAWGAVEVTRVDAHTLRLRPERGFVGAEVQHMIWDPRRPMPVGYEVTLSNMTVTVTDATPRGRPLEALFRFEHPLESPEYLWMTWSWGGLVPWPLPEVGETTVVSTSLLPPGLFLAPVQSGE